MKTFKERLDGKYDAVIPSPLLPKGWVSDGSNMRKASIIGGWKPRKGCMLLNTSQAKSGAALVSIHQYTNPFFGDYHLISQIGQDLLDTSGVFTPLITESGEELLTEDLDVLLYESGDDPLDQRASLGSSILASGVTIDGGVPGFSTTVGEDFIYADGAAAPVIYGGTDPWCVAFVVYDSSASAYVDYTSEVTDGRIDTNAVLGNGASDVYYVCSTERANAIKLVFGSTLNNNAVDPTVSAWRSGAWADVSATDGTKDTQTHDTDGEFTWTRNANDKMRVIAGVMGYWYRVSFSGALDAVTITACRVGRLAEHLTNKWDGLFEFTAGALFYDQSADIYNDILGSVSDESVSTYLDLNTATTSDYIYIKTVEPAAGFGFAVVVGKDNAADAQVDQIDYWNGNAWTAITTNITDETLDPSADSSFSTTGTIWFDSSAISPVKRTWQGDPVSGYWYRLSWDASLEAADIFIYQMLYAAHPKSLSPYRGAVEFDGRLYLWGDPEFPNRLRYSASGRADRLSGEDSGYTKIFGGEKETILLVLKLYQYLIVFKRSGIWTYDTNGVIARIADDIGIGSVKSAQVVEIGLAGMKRDDLVSVCLWQYLDGIYALDGVKPKKISGPIDNYFDPEYDDVLEEGELLSLQSYKDPVKNEYHFLTSTVELVYNYRTDEWYPPWNRNIILNCGLNVTDIFNRRVTVGGSSNGYMMKLEVDTTDKTSGDADVAISHYITTRSISAVPEESTTFRFTPRRLWTEFKARSAGLATVSYIKPDAAGATSLGTMSMINASAEMAIDKHDMSLENTSAVAFKFLNATADQQMEIWSILYSVDAVGEIKL